MPNEESKERPEASPAEEAIALPFQLKPPSRPAITQNIQEDLRPVKGVQSTLRDSVVKTVSFKRSEINLTRVVPDCKKMAVINKAHSARQLIQLGSKPS